MCLESSPCCPTVKDSAENRGPHPRGDQISETVESVEDVLCVLSGVAAQVPSLDFVSYSWDSRGEAGLVDGEANMLLEGAPDCAFDSVFVLITRRSL